jgi:hypothetical protein
MNPRTQIAPRPWSCGRYFRRRPLITSTTPENKASAVPAEAGLISGTLRGPATAILPKLRHTNTTPANFMEESPFRLLGDRLLEIGLKKYKVLTSRNDSTNVDDLSWYAQP